MQVFALWYGGASYSWGTVEDNLETFPSMRAAREAFIDREVPRAASYYPCVDRDTSQMWVYFYDPRDVPDPYPDRVFSFGPRGGVRAERG